MNIFFNIRLFLLWFAVWHCHAVVENYHRIFKQFQLRYNKHYENDVEERHRENVFLNNLALIEQHNQNKTRVGGFVLDLNEYADWTTDEFQNFMNGNDEHQSVFNQGVAFLPPANVQLPEAVDWRALGAVSPVKKQLKCGACWAFAATGALEGQHFRLTSELVVLSEQNLLDCTTLYGNKGCKGGNKERSYLYIRDNGGIDTELSYPYRAIKDFDCQFDAASIGAKMKAFASIIPMDELALKAAVATVGPISVAINGKCLKKLQFYKRGIFTAESDCDKEELTHAVLIVGYDKDNENGMDYWIVKNSWGEEWGMGGYILVPRGENFAGIAMRASYPLV